MFQLSSGSPMYRLELLPVSSYLQVGQNTLYVTAEGNGEANYYIIKTPAEAAEQTVTPEAAKIKQLVVATVKISPRD